jgi:hypothetical protein
VTFLADYRVDSADYLTRISMGGEATYRYALHRPELLPPADGCFDPNIFPEPFAGPAPLRFQWNASKISRSGLHGADDRIVPLAAAQSTGSPEQPAERPLHRTSGRRHGVDGDARRAAFYEWLPS